MYVCNYIAWVYKAAFPHYYPFSARCGGRVALNGEEGPTDLFDSGLALAEEIPSVRGVVVFPEWLHYNVVDFAGK